MVKRADRVQLPSNIPTGPVFGLEEVAAVKAVVESGAITQLSTDHVETFEQGFARYVGAKEAIAVNSGTSAIHSALIAAGVDAGDEVIVTPFTFIGTVGPILHQKAIPVFVDIDPQTYCMNALEIEQKITKKTKAILPVDLFGHPADLDAILAIAATYDLTVVEDACQSHGAEYKGRKLGSISPLTAFSFQESKNMTTGEGGMVTTNDPNLADICRKIRHQGEVSWGEIARVGYSYRMTALQAVIGSEQLKKLDSFNTTRVKIAAIYSSALQGLSLYLPQSADYARSVCHVYSFLLPQEAAAKRSLIMRDLHKERVPAMIAYPKPLYQSPVFQTYQIAPCPVCEDISARVITLSTAASIPLDLAEDIGSVTHAILAKHL